MRTNSNATPAQKAAAAAKWAAMMQAAQNAAPSPNALTHAQRGAVRNPRTGNWEYPSTQASNAALNRPRTAQETTNGFWSTPDPYRPPATGTGDWAQPATGAELAAINAATAAAKLRGSQPPRNSAGQFVGAGQYPSGTAAQQAAQAASFAAGNRTYDNPNYNRSRPIGVGNMPTISSTAPTRTAADWPNDVVRLPTGGTTASRDSLYGTPDPNSPGQRFGPPAYTGPQYRPPASSNPTPLSTIPFVGNPVRTPYQTAPTYTPPATSNPNNYRPPAPTMTGSGYTPEQEAFIASYNSQTQPQYTQVRLADDLYGWGTPAPIGTNKYGTPAPKAWYDEQAAISWANYQATQPYRDPLYDSNGNWITGKTAQNTPPVTPQPYNPMPPSSPPRTSSLPGGIRPSPQRWPTPNQPDPGNQYAGSFPQGDWRNEPISDVFPARPVTAEAAAALKASIANTTPADYARYTAASEAGEAKRQAEYKARQTLAGTFPQGDWRNDPNLRIDTKQNTPRPTGSSQAPTGPTAPITSPSTSGMTGSGSQSYQDHQRQMQRDIADPTSPWYGYTLSSDGQVPRPPAPINYAAYNQPDQSNNYQQPQQPIPGSWADQMQQRTATRYPTTTPAGQINASSPADQRQQNITNSQATRTQAQIESQRITPKGGYGGDNGRHMNDFDNAVRNSPIPITSTITPPPSRWPAPNQPDTSNNYQQPPLTYGPRQTAETGWVPSPQPQSSQFGFDYGPPPQMSDRVSRLAGAGAPAKVPAWMTAGNKR